MLKKSATIIQDQLETPNRKKRVWVINEVRIIAEAHPYDEGSEAYHHDLHFHVTCNSLGLDHSRGTPNEPIPSKLYFGLNNS